MIYCVKYLLGDAWQVNRFNDFIEALLFVTRLSSHFQIWHQNSKKLTERTLVAYQGEF